jgi:hypothetical protein
VSVPVWLSGRRWAEVGAIVLMFILGTLGLVVRFLPRIIPWMLYTAPVWLRAGVDRVRIPSRGFVFVWIVWTFTQIVWFVWVMRQGDPLHSDP